MFKKMKNMKIGLWLISLASSIVLWIFVTGVVNPEDKTTVTAIKPALIGEESIAEKNLALLDKDNLTLSVTVSGRRMDLVKLTSDQIAAEIDLSDITEPGRQKQKFSVRLPQTVTLVDDQNSLTAELNIDNITEVPVDIKMNLEGSFAEGYKMDKSVFDPSMLKVKGPQSIIQTINHAQVTLSMDNIRENVSESFPFILIDDGGNELPKTGLSFETEQVNATVTVNMEKDVLLAVDFIDGGGATRENIEYSIDPPAIKLSGNPAIMDGLNQLIIGKIDLASIISSSTVKFDIPLPNNINNDESVKTASVAFQIKGLVTKTLDVTNIQIINPPEGRQARLITNMIKIQVRGPQGSINRITAQNIKVVADLAGHNLPAGRHNVDVVTTISGYGDTGVVGTGYNIEVDVQSAAQSSAAS